MQDGDELRELFAALNTEVSTFPDDEMVLKRAAAAFWDAALWAESVRSSAELRSNLLGSLDGLARPPQGVAAVREQLSTALQNALRCAHDPDRQREALRTRLEDLAGETAGNSTLQGVLAAVRRLPREDPVIDRAST